MLLFSPLEYVFFSPFRDVTFSSTEQITFLPTWISYCSVNMLPFHLPEHTSFQFLNMYFQFSWICYFKYYWSCFFSGPPEHAICQSPWFIFKSPWICLFSVLQNMLLFSQFRICYFSVLLNVLVYFPFLLNVVLINPLEYVTSQSSWMYFIFELTWICAQFFWKILCLSVLMNMFLFCLPKCILFFSSTVYALSSPE